MDNHVISVCEITKTFKKKKVINNISFDINRGDIFGYIGRNGAGKTTTIRILLGLLRKTSGEVSVLGNDPWTATRKYRKKIGVLLEDDCLYPNLTISENLNYFAELYGLEKKLIKYNTEKILSFLEVDYDENCPVEKFSKGMRKRVALARAFIGDPEIIFLDDPTANMDIESQRLVRDLIKRLVHEEGKTIFITSQNLIELEKLCNKVAIINKGNIIEYGELVNIVNKYQQKRMKIKIKIKEDKDIEKTLKILSDMSFIEKYDSDGREIYIYLNNKENDCYINLELIKNNILVEEIRHEVVDLEEVYLEILRGIAE